MICLVASDRLAPLPWERLLFNGGDHTIVLLNNKNRTAFTDRFAKGALAHIQPARDLGVTS